MARLSNEELKSQFPSFNYPDIGAVFYGDIPANTVDWNFVEKWGDCITLKFFHTELSLWFIYGKLSGFGINASAINLCNFLLYICPSLRIFTLK